MAKFLFFLNTNNKYRSSKVYCESFMLTAHTDPLGFLSTFRAFKSRERQGCSKSASIHREGTCSMFYENLSLWEELPIPLQMKSRLCSPSMLCRWQSLSLPQCTFVQQVALGGNKSHSSVEWLTFPNMKWKSLWSDISCFAIPSWEHSKNYL